MDEGKGGDGTAIFQRNPADCIQVGPCNCISTSLQFLGQPESGQVSGIEEAFCDNYVAAPWTDTSFPQDSITSVGPTSSAGLVGQDSITSVRTGSPRSSPRRQAVPARCLVGGRVSQVRREVVEHLQKPLPVAQNQERFGASDELSAQAARSSFGPQFLLGIARDDPSQFASRLGFAASILCPGGLMLPMDSFLAGLQFEGEISETVVAMFGYTSAQLGELASQEYALEYARPLKNDGGWHLQCEQLGPNAHAEQLDPNAHDSSNTEEAILPTVTPQEKQMRKNALVKERSFEINRKFLPENSASRLEGARFQQECCTTEAHADEDDEQNSARNVGTPSSEKTPCDHSLKDFGTSSQQTPATTLLRNRGAVAGGNVVFPISPVKVIPADVESPELPLWPSGGWRFGSKNRSRKLFEGLGLSPRRAPATSGNTRRNHEYKTPATLPAMVTPSFAVQQAKRRKEIKRELDWNSTRIPAKQDALERCERSLWMQRKVVGQERSGRSKGKTIFKHSSEAVPGQIGPLSGAKKNVYGDWYGSPLQVFCSSVCFCSEAERNSNIAMDSLVLQTHQDLRSALEGNANGFEMLHFIEPLCRELQVPQHIQQLICSDDGAWADDAENASVTLYRVTQELLAFRDATVLIISSLLQQEQVFQKWKRAKCPLPPLSAQKSKGRYSCDSPVLASAVVRDAEHEQLCQMTQNIAQFISSWGQKYAHPPWSLAGFERTDPPPAVFMWRGVNALIQIELCAALLTSTVVNEAGDEVNLKTDPMESEGPRNCADRAALNFSRGLRATLRGGRMPAQVL